MKPLHFSNLIGEGIQNGLVLMPYSYLYDLIGIGGELSSLTMIFWITFQIILIFVSSETGKIWEILNCFVNIFCWFFFEVKKNSWQKFTSVEPQIYMFSQMWNSFMNINIHKYSPCSLSTDVLQHYISGKQL